ncbi:MAG TPA: thiol-disulfide oxidoreductase DCC family protein [Flavobacteriaceae bacterium]|nr:thiol-disulfide oxidoreductase DCC family protein [Flavobacteriaceae bacterium]
MKNKKIVLFDGVCNLCNNAVTFIIAHDKKDVFRFASLQSEIGKKLTQERGIETSEVDSIVLIDPGNAYFVKSSAALEIAKELSGYSWMRIFLYLPEWMRDFIYDIIAKNRYSWFGKKDNCMIPTEELRGKFLE